MSDVWAILIWEGDSTAAQRLAGEKLKKAYSYTDRAITAHLENVSSTPVQFPCSYAQLTSYISMRFNNVASSLWHNCEQATFSAYMPEIEEEDIVQIFMKGREGSLSEDQTHFYPRFIGRAEDVANPHNRNNTPQQYRIRSPLFDFEGHIFDGEQISPPYDIGELAEAYLTAYLPAICIDQNCDSLGTDDTTYFNANYDTLKNVLQSLKSKAVKLGASYHYGVTGYGVAYFRKLGIDVFSVTEQSTEQRVYWPSKQNNDYVNQVLWNIGKGNVPYLWGFTYYNTLDTDDLLIHESPAGAGPYTRAIVEPVPEDLFPVVRVPFSELDFTIADGTLTESYQADGTTQDGTATLERVCDGAPESYAVIEASKVGGGYDFYIILDIDSGSSLKIKDIVGFSLRYSFGDVNLEHTVNVSVFGQNVKKSLDDFDTFMLVGNRGRYVNPENEFGDLSVIPYFLLVEIRNASAGPATLNLYLEDMSFYKLETDELDARAPTFYKGPKTLSFKAYKVGQHLFGTYAAIQKYSGAEFTGLSVDEHEITIGAGHDEEFAGVKTWVTIGEGAVLGMEGKLGKKTQVENEATFRAVAKRINNA